MMTVSSALLTAQQNTLAKPYIKCTINGTNYWSRLIDVKHIEEPYKGYANIILENHDRALDSVDMTGYEVALAYGHETGQVVAEPNGDNDVNEYLHRPNLWVKEQSITSIEGESVCELYCEDMWIKLRETKVVAYGANISKLTTAGSSMVVADKFTFEGTHTIYQLIHMIIHDVMNWTLSDLATSDGIIDVTKPWFQVSNTQPSTAAELLYQLIYMTKSYIRAKYDKTFEIVYPQIADTANRTFYSSQVPYFNEYRERVKVLIPNSIAVFCNNPQRLDPWPTTTLVGTASSVHAVYGEVLDIDFAPGVVTQVDANLVASGILTKILAEKDAGRLVMAHDAGVELYDKLTIIDTRGF